MGSKESFVYLASPVSVAAAAIEGKIVDPRKYL
jgi:3-isopropylmalate/(R)-2-methylmalate dehydratase large subunit